MNHSAQNSEFCRLCSGETSVNLVRLLLEFAADAYPELDAAKYETEVERLGNVAAARAGEAANGFLLGKQTGTSNAPGVQQTSVEVIHRGLTATSQVLYEEEGFHGNESDYCDPRNSYLNDVIRRRTGIPITLAVLYIAVARRVGLPVYGVGAPGHFLVGCHTAVEPLYVDPFHSGDVLCERECRLRIEDTAGAAAWSERCLRPSSHREIAARVLRNLKFALAKQESWTKALPVQRRLTCLLPECPEERRDLGLILLRTGDPIAAYSHLTQFLEERPAAAEQLDPFVRAARRMTSELN